MKILFLPKYSALGASSRMRTHQYLPFYRAAGLECTVEPFFDDDYLKNLYAGKSNNLNVIAYYFKRLFILFTVFKYDKIFLEKEIFPYVPAFAERILAIMRKKYIVDYDDAIFHNYDQSSHRLVQQFLAKKIDGVMKNAESVVVGNSYLEQHALYAEAKKGYIIPTVIDLERYPNPIFEVDNHNHSDSHSKYIVGWIGTKSTFEKHLLLIKDWLIKAQELFPIELHIVGLPSSPIFLGKHVKYIPWSEDTEVERISQFDIGIMPLKDSLWEQGKCAYKLIQYLACGKPVIASNVGMNKDLCQHGETGFLADTEEEFLKALQVLLTDQDLRIRMGRQGRELIEEQYNVAITSKELIKILSA